MPKGFSRFINLAGSYLKNPDTRLRFLQAVKEYAKNKNALIKHFRGDLQMLTGLVKDWHRGAYTRISSNKIVLVIAALLYFLSPIDTVPDFLGLIGFTDDAAVILFVLNSLRKEIDRYRQWKSE
jgi:uncharacterized membrane protein YkvA (DUF1232 family)